MGLTGGGGKEGESKCEEVVVISTVDGYNLECIAVDTTWGVAFHGIPIISVDDLLLLLIIQIHCNFI